MPINITTAGGAGTHSFARTNINAADDYIYYKNTSGDVIPATMTVGKTFIYTPGIGSLVGINSGDLLYVVTPNPKQLKFSATSGGSPVNITGESAGSIKFNTPIVYSNKLNIDGQTADRQAVKYYTDSTPLTGLTSGSTYFLKNVSISDFAGAQALYTLAGNTHTFTSAGVTGATPPTISQLRTSYTGATTWSSTYLAQGNFQGYQDWTVPVSGTYEFTASGASGYDGSGAGGVGRGAIVKGRVNLTKGEIITIVCGQRGAAPSSGTIWGGSGGGTFVVRKTGVQPLFIAGGGSGESNSGAGRDGVLTALAGTSSGGISSGGYSGYGGTTTGGYSAAGGGFLGRGDNSSTAEIGGGSFQDGLQMNSTNTRIGGYGGFGGGGQSDGNSQGQSGGAGGYSGGGGARNTSANNSGGGGGSFITSIASNVATSNGLWEGSGTFGSAGAITNLASYNTGDGTVAVSLISSFTTGHTVHPTATDAAAGTNAIAITPQGSAFHAFVPITVDLTANTFNFPDAHGLVTGNAITYSTSGTLVGGMALSTIYYVNKVDNYTYKLSINPSLTPELDITAPSASTNDTFSKVIVNTATETITVPSHGFLANQPIKYLTNGGTPITPLQNNATYYVKTVVDQNNITLSQSLNGPVINLTSAGTGTGHSFVYIVVNISEDSIYIPGHDLSTGQKIVYSNGGGATIGGLTNGSQYYVYKIDNNIIKLSTNKVGTAIVDITGVGTGNHTLTTNSVDFAIDQFSVPNHGFSQGELVQYDAVGQTAIGGLTSGSPYYIILVDGDNFKLATSLINATAGTAVDITTAGVGKHRILSLTKSPDGTYTVASVPTAYTFTVSAGGYVPAITKTFTPRAVVNTQANNLKVLSHGFITGTKVLYNNNGGTSIGGLTNNTNYYVIGINKDYLRLAATADDAASGVAITFTNFGAGVDHTLVTYQINGNVTGSGTVTTTAGSTLVTGSNTAFSKILKVGDRFRIFPPNTVNSKTFAASNVIGGSTNTITITTHGFVTTDVVLFLSGTGVAPGGLTTNQYYYIGRVDANVVKLYNSSTDANSGTNAVAFATVGTGTDFTLTKTTPSSPIIRRITAIGADNQLTVDRAYASTYTSVSYSYSTFIYTRPQGYNLHRSFDGGVEMSVGSNTSYGQIIRQTRKYFRYQSGKGLQTSFGINFKPTIDLENVRRISATTFQGTTRRPHGLVNGLYIEISGCTDSTGVDSTLYNGIFQVTVLDSTNFTCLATSTLPTGTESKAFGFPQFYVRSWTNGAVRAGMFDFQNGMFFEYDGQKIYAVRRSSTQQLAGTSAALQGSEFVFGTGTTFTTQLAVGDYIVMRGQSYKISSVISDTRITVKPEYKGSTGTEKEFDPGNGTTGVVRTATNTFNINSHGFTHLLPVVYNSIDGTAIGGLINGRTYYVNLIDNNNFKLYPSPDSVQNVTIADVGAGTPHSFTPAKSGIIMTKTVDTRTPQEQWSLDVCDGTGTTGYNLDLSKIQMAYMDYSWYGAGKIRYGFKTVQGEVRYVHEYIHNNKKLESYFRSGNLPARYEVVTFDTPTYIPFLFHWGTSVIMDGKFDDDKAYLFTQSGNTLSISGTTTKTFGSTSLITATDRINIPAHGFATGDAVVFEGRTRAGLIGTNANNPQTPSTGFHPYTNLQNAQVYYVRSVDANNLSLHGNQTDALFNSGAGQNTIDLQTQGNAQYTFYIYPLGAYNNSSGAAYQPLLSIRLSPSVSSGLTGKLGDRDVLNRMQLRLREVSVQSTQLVDVKLLINGRLNNLNFAGVTQPSLAQAIQHTSNDTISGGTQVYNFRATGNNGIEASTVVNIGDLFEMSNSILGGDSIFPDGPDIITIAAARLTGNVTQTSAKLTWTEAQA